MQTSQNVQTKLFVGFLVSPEVRLHLNGSPIWHQVQVVKKEEDLQELRQNDKSYIGRFIPNKEPTLQELKYFIVNIKKKLEFYCPDLKTAHLKSCIFPQLFLH